MDDYQDMMDEQRGSIIDDVCRAAAIDIAKNGTPRSDAIGGALGDILREREKEENYQMGRPDDPPISLTGEAVSGPKLTEKEKAQVKAIEKDIYDAVERAVDEAGF
ncbi:hypothetical protein [Marinomonas gallaica]|uniref:hypothetical protein n=1 Tax=Marinomonas gallaica TaxID=1806667 RepID=UPI00082DEABE|nr:hypothetical protein [Marinomonas gallaica]